MVGCDTSNLSKIHRLEDATSLVWHMNTCDCKKVGKSIEEDRQGVTLGELDRPVEGPGLVSAPCKEGIG